jgi:hypothetical protein
VAGRPRCTTHHGLTRSSHTRAPRARPAALPAADGRRAGPAQALAAAAAAELDAALRAQLPRPTQAEKTETSITLSLARATRLADAGDDMARPRAGPPHAREGAPAALRAAGRGRRRCSPRGGGWARGRGRAARARSGRGGSALRKIGLGFYQPYPWPDAPAPRAAAAGLQLGAGPARGDRRHLAHRARRERQPPHHRRRPHGRHQVCLPRARRCGPRRDAAMCPAAGYSTARSARRPVRCRGLFPRGACAVRSGAAVCRCWLDAGGATAPRPAPPTATLGVELHRRAGRLTPWRRTRRSVRGEGRVWRVLRGVDVHDAGAARVLFYPTLPYPAAPHPSPCLAPHSRRAPELHRPDGPRMQREPASYRPVSPACSALPPRAPGMQRVSARANAARRRAARRASPRRSAARPRRPRWRPAAARARRAAGATRPRGAGAPARQRTPAKMPRPRARACRRAARPRARAPRPQRVRSRGSRPAGADDSARPACCACAAGSAGAPTAPCEGGLGGRVDGDARGRGVRSGEVAGAAARAQAARAGGGRVCMAACAARALNRNRA